MSAPYAPIPTVDHDKGEEDAEQDWEDDVDIREYEPEQVHRDSRLRRLVTVRAVVVAALVLLAVAITALVFGLLHSRPRASPGPRAPVTAAHQQRPTSECKRILVRKFNSLDAGFGSEYGVYLRAKALSADLDWTVVPDTRDWIYGNLDEIFVPPTYDCILPLDVLNTSGPPWQEFGTPRWQNADRIYLTREYRHLLTLERVVRENQVDRDTVDEFVQKVKLWSMDEEHLTLPYGESVPRGEEKGFLAQAAILEKEWVPNDAMQAQIDRLRSKVGLNDTATRRRRPVVVLQIRLGDKRTEATDIPKSGSHMKQDDMSVYFHAAKLAVARLYSGRFTSTPFSGSSNRPKPLLVIMTAEAGIVESIAALDKDKQFEVILTPSEELTPAQKAEFDRVFVSSAPRRGPSTSSPVPRSLSRRWLQKELLNASPDLRLALTRQLIAELIVYSKYADAFVVSGNSNMGRIALTLAGEEGALGPPGQRATGGRVRSIDVPWFPGMWFMSPFAPNQFNG
ncbi:hypothetical protein AURDEDRAFT_148185 [Auricularia subglabra TFB-10046 SS5]|nr:hypothetical protein AURDEDRAFT_148185 [Auricularia subglabra TFB-10046 SS5]